MFLTNISKYRYTPKSAEWALIIDFYDYDKSGGAAEFRNWAITKGAKVNLSYEAWQKKLPGLVKKNGITKPSSRPQKAPLVPRSAFCGG